MFSIEDYFKEINDELLEMPGRTDEEKQFLATDYAPEMAKNFLAWDEIESLGYIFFKDGYIDKYKPGGGCYACAMMESEAYDFARRMKCGEDIRRELAKAFVDTTKHQKLDLAGETAWGDDEGIDAIYGELVITLDYNGLQKYLTYETLGGAFLNLFEKEYLDIKRAVEEEERAEAKKEQPEMIRKNRGRKM